MVHVVYYTLMSFQLAEKKDLYPGRTLKMMRQYQSINDVIIPKDIVVLVVAIYESDDAWITTVLMSAGTDLVRMPRWWVERYCEIFDKR